MQEKVKEILLMEIECNKKNYKTIERVKCENRDIIKTSQKYIRKSDPDMSDFAIGFYKIIYKDILNGQNILDEKGYLQNKELFAGDTMNSFKIIQRRNPKDDILEGYKHQYHCLANFWLIPMEMGRTIKGKYNKCRNPICDYMDNFLEMIKKENEKTLKNPLMEYYKKFETDWSIFIKKHFLGKYVNSKNEINIYSEKEKNTENIIEAMIKNIKARAEDIAASQYCEELWNYFNQYDLFN